MLRKAEAKGLLGAVQKSKPKGLLDPDDPKTKLQARLDRMAQSAFVQDTLFRLAGGPVDLRAGDFTHAAAETSQTEDTLSVSSTWANASDEELERILMGEIGQTIYKRKGLYHDDLRWDIESIAADPRARAPFERVSGMGLAPGAEAVRAATMYALQQLRGEASGDAPQGAMTLTRRFRQMLK